MAVQTKRNYAKLIWRKILTPSTPPPLFCSRVREVALRETDKSKSEFACHRLKVNTVNFLSKLFVLVYEDMKRMMRNYLWSDLRRQMMQLNTTYLVRAHPIVLGLL